MSAHDERAACCADPEDYVCRATLADPEPDDVFEVVRGRGPGGAITIRVKNRDVVVHAHDWRIWRTQGEVLAAELMR